MPNGTEVERTDEKVAEQVGFSSGRTYQRAKKVWEKAKEEDKKAQEEVEKLDKGNTTIKSAHRQVKRKENLEERKEQEPTSIRHLIEVMMNMNKLLIR